MYERVKKEEEFKYWRKFESFYCGKTLNLYPFPKGRKKYQTVKNLYLCLCIYVFQHVVSRGVFRTQSNIYYGAFFVKILAAFSRSPFRKKAPS